MRLRFACLASALLLSVFCVSCGVRSLTGINITPSSAAIAAGQTVQFTAIGTYGHGSSHPTSTADITNSVTWNSSVTAVATIDSNGLATAVADGTTTITASHGGTIATVTLQVGSGSGGTLNGLTTLTIIPGSQSTTTPGETAQFLAIGTFAAAPITQDITNKVVWFSSDLGVATVSSSGLATSGVIPQGATTITAIATNSDGSIITGSAAMTTSNSTGGQLPNLAVYSVGQGTGTITSSPSGINCTTGIGCSAFYPSGTTVTLTAVAASGSVVFGWSSNCSTTSPLPAQTATCTLTLPSPNGTGGNAAVGVIFDTTP